LRLNLLCDFGDICGETDFAFKIFLVILSKIDTFCDPRTSGSCGHKGSSLAQKASSAKIQKLSSFSPKKGLPSSQGRKP
jgi:hypothetical protein